MTGRPSVDADQRIRAAVADALYSSGYAALNLVGCEVHGNQIILRGNVPTYHLKQLAQTFVQRAAGTRRIDNRLAVRQYDR